MVTVGIRIVTLVIASMFSLSASNIAMRNTLYVLTRLCFYSSINTTSSTERSPLECAISCSQYGSCDIFRFCESETTLDCDFLHSYIPIYDVRCLNTSSTWMCKYAKKVTSPVNVTTTVAMTTHISQSTMAVLFQTTQMMSTTPNSAGITTQNSVGSTTEHGTTQPNTNPTTQEHMSTTSGAVTQGSAEVD